MNDYVGYIIDIESVNRGIARLERYRGAYKHPKVGHNGTKTMNSNWYLTDEDAWSSADIFDLVYNHPESPYTASSRLKDFLEDRRK